RQDSTTPAREHYYLSLRDALPICDEWRSQALAGDFEDLAELGFVSGGIPVAGKFDPRRFPLRCLQQVLCPDGHARRGCPGARGRDRKSTRLNSSHVKISYAVFCLK